ncbi:cell cycle checkpoint protein RAD1 isoform X2 [Bacillus rossius redtenbacheri]|uniref:cell cycle checkpoint protein RAD1 isoform X2 n=1 Tax=Bacillus rossius redtenbacheri TaxID=93214 RepID=UPI002FDDBF81
MALTSQDSNIDTDFLFVAQLDSVKSVLMLLKAVNFKETALCIVTDRGLRITVEDARSVQASAFVQSEMFQEYLVQDDQVIFKIHLGVLVECLSIFGGAATTVKMRYQGYGSPLTLLLEEDGVITDCNIRTLEPDSPLEYSFQPDDVVNKVILHSESFREVFSDLDPSSDLLEMTLTPDPGQLCFTTDGQAGETQISIPKDSELIEAFDCSVKTVSRYQFSYIKPSLKALAISAKASVRINEQGLLCFQYMVPTEVETCFIEYYCLPLTDDNMD